jgi:hypothetical protein
MPDFQKTLHAADVATAEQASKSAARIARR